MCNYQHLQIFLRFLPLVSINYEVYQQFRDRAYKNKMLEIKRNVLFSF
jgi:hypothetical protein